MQSKKRCSCYLLVFLLFIGSNLFAQSGQIDTILVNLSSDTSTKSSQTITEPTPTLDLGALRVKAREDSIRIAQIAQEKKDTEKARIAKIKEKKKEEKLAKEQEQKAIAEKKKIEKEEKKKETLARKSAEKVAKERALQVKKEKEKKAAALAAKEKESKKKLEIAKKAEAEKLKAKEAELIKEKAKKKLEAEKAVEAKKLAKEKKESKVEANKIVNKIPETITPKADSIPITTKVQAPSPAVIAKKEVADNLPKPPKGVVQKDNPYGTVRLAYDENAASFLLSIPTETKMHYHAKHSEQVMLIEGDGMLLMGYKTIKLKKNELIFITQGTPHKIINNGKAKLKVLSIQSPFYDGTDIIILE